MRLRCRKDAAGCEAASRGLGGNSSRNLELHGLEWHRRAEVRRQLHAFELCGRAVSWGPLILVRRPIPHPSFYAWMAMHLVNHTPLVCA